MAAHTRAHGGTRVAFYGCSSFWNRGSSVSGNNVAARVDLVDDEVLATLRDDILRPPVVERALALALEELAPLERPTASSRGLLLEIADLETECARLAEPIAQGGELEALVRRLRDREDPS